MKFEKDTRGIKRYIAFDIHKEYALAGGQNAQQEWVMAPRRIGMEKVREWGAANLRKGDAVVIETTTNVWDVYDIVEPLVSYVVVAHAGGVRQIAEARVKTDKKDIERLIRLLIADIPQSVGEDQHHDPQSPAKSDPPSQSNSAEGEVEGQGLVGGAEGECVREDPNSAGIGNAG